MNDLYQFFGATGIQAEDYVTETDIRKWIDQMMRSSEGKPLAVSTINRRLNALRSFYTWARKNKKFQHNPMEGIEDLLIRMRKTPVNSRGVDPDEKYRRDRAVVYLLTYAGLRVEELSILKLTDLDLEMKRIRVVGKGNKVRTIPFRILSSKNYTIG